MPAKSKAQRRFFALALQYKRGEIKDSEVSDEVKELSKLPEKTLKDFAETSEKKLPSTIGENEMNAANLPTAIFCALITYQSFLMSFFLINGVIMMGDKYKEYQAKSIYFIYR